MQALLTMLLNGSGQPAQQPINQQRSAAVYTVEQERAALRQAEYIINENKRLQAENAQLRQQLQEAQSKSGNDFWSNQRIQRNSSFSVNSAPMIMGD